MAEFPFISVIVPIYNSEQYVLRCISNILLQTFTDFEVLLVDDGSTDFSGKICDDFCVKDDRVRVFHKSNGGVSSARNLGLQEAKGKWIAFCDSDDEVEREWLAIFYEQIQAYDTDLVNQGLVKVEKSTGKRIHVGLDFKGSSEEALMRLYENVELAFCWNKIFKSAIIQKYQLRFNEAISFMEDEEFVLRYLKYCRFVICTPQIGYVYALSETGKYSLKDNYYTALSSFQSVKSILNDAENSVYKDFLRMLVNGLFASYSNPSLGKGEMKKRLILFHESVGYEVMNVRELSIVSRILLCCLPLSVSHVLLLIKRKVCN